MTHSNTVVERVVLPLYAHGDESRLILFATVLASWFEAPLQLVAPDDAAADECRSLAKTLGVATEPVVSLGSSGSFISGLVDHLRRAGDSLCVTTASRGGLEVALSGGHSTFLVPELHRARVPSGPLCVELTGEAADQAALATSAAWGRKLECGVRLVVDRGSIDIGQLDAAEQRLSEMGIDVGIDSINAGNRAPLVLVGRTRDATALVIPPDRVTDTGVVSDAEAHGVAVLVTAALDAASGQAADGTDSDHTRSVEAPTSRIKGLETMAYDECLQALGSHSVARVAYIDHGWPTVVPVNYAIKDGDIFIRSHAGGKLDAARRHDVVCLEVDAVDEASKTGWSVVGHGNLEVVSDPTTLYNAWESDPTPWVESSEWHWLRLRPFSLSGRRVPAPASTTQEE